MIVIAAFLALLALASFMTFVIWLTEREIDIRIGVTSLIVSIISTIVLAIFAEVSSAPPSPVKAQCESIEGAAFSEADEACYVNGIKLNFQEEQ